MYAIRFVLCTIVGLLVSAGVSAESAPLKWLEDKGVQMRKSFSGTLKDSNAPAAFAYDSPDSGDKIFRADVAVKVIEIPLYEPSGLSHHGIRLAPLVEYHRSTKDLDEVNKQSVAANVEYEYGFDAGFTNAIVADIKYELGHDSVLDQTIRVASLKAGVVGDIDPLPGAWFRSGPEGKEVFRYYPSIGWERYEKLAIKEKRGADNVVVAPAIDTSLAFARLNAEYRPFVTVLDGRLVFITTYTYRHRTSGDAMVPKSSRLFEATLDYYLDEKKRIGIGLSYQSGRDPNRNFLDETSSSLGIKIKLGG